MNTSSSKESVCEQRNIQRAYLRKRQGETRGERIERKKESENETGRDEERCKKRRKNDLRKTRNKITKTEARKK